MRAAVDAEEGGETPERTGEPEPARPDVWLRRAFVVSAVASVLSMVSAAVLAIHHQWVPLGDHAIFAVRARDVFSSHPPLVGTWTSASLATGVNVNNPGPLYYDALAVPTVLVGSAGAGIAVGVALINTLCGLGAGWIARRQGGLLVGSLAFAVIAVLAWSLGSEVLLDPTQPPAMLLPALLFFMLAWGVARRDVVLLPFLVGVASLILQTYVTYVYLVAILGVWAIVCMVLRLRSPDATPDDHRRARRSVVAAVIVGVVCWAQPVWQQLFGPGPGNFSRLLRAARQPQHAVGFGTGTRLVADVVALPPFWFRPAFRDFLATVRQPSSSLPVALLVIAAVVALLVGLMLASRRRRDRVVVTAAATAVVTIGAALVTAARIPLVPQFLGIDPHVYRWLWPLAAFVTFVLLVAIVRLAVPARWTNIVAGVAAAVAVLFALLNVPTSNQGSSALDSATPVVRDLGHQLAALKGRGPVAVDMTVRRFADPYPASMLAMLQGHGIPFVVTGDEPTLYQVGFFRRFDGHNARLRMTIREGDDYDKAPPGAERVALHFGLSTDERAEMARLQEILASAVAEGRFSLNENGARDVQAGKAVALPVGASHDTALGFVGSVPFADLVARGDLVVDPQLRPTLDRYLDLHSRWLLDTVAIYTTAAGPA